jgi:hypothetical protein
MLWMLSPSIEPSVRRSVDVPDAAVPRAALRLRSNEISLGHGVRDAVFVRCDQNGSRVERSDLVDPSVVQLFSRQIRSISVAGMAASIASI